MKKTHSTQAHRALPLKSSIAAATAIPSRPSFISAHSQLPGACPLCRADRRSDLARTQMHLAARSSTLHRTPRRPPLGAAPSAQRLRGFVRAARCWTLRARCRRRQQGQSDAAASGKTRRPVTHTPLASAAAAGTPAARSRCTAGARRRAGNRSVARTMEISAASHALRTSERPSNRSGL